MTNAKVNKMAEAKKIYDEVYASGATKPRKVFVERAIAELEMSPAGASSYHQLLKRAAEGKQKYAHHINANRKRAKKAAPVAEVVAEVKGPWQAIKGELVEYFPTRDAARTHNKDNGGGFKISKIA